MKTEVYSVCDYGEIEELVLEHFGISYSLPEDLETGNDTSQSFSFKIEELDEYDAKKLKDFIAGIETSYVTCVILQELVNKKVIPEGNLLIEVCW